MHNFISCVGSYLCTKSDCRTDSSHIENIDWGYHNDTDGTKHACQSKCSSSPNCGAYEWSDANANEKCIWWKKGACQQRNDTTSDDRKFVNCKKIGTTLISIFDLY